MIDRETVERWTIVDDGDGIPYGALSHIGEYVRYRDYAILSARVAELEKERDTLRQWDNYFRAQCGFKRDGRPSPECLDEYLENVLRDDLVVSVDALLTVKAERDEAHARVAAAYGDAALSLSAWLDEYPWHGSLASDIRALATDADRDALAERDKRIRAEERERLADPDWVAQLIRTCDGNHDKGAVEIGEFIASAIRKGDEDE